MGRILKRFNEERHKLNTRIKELEEGIEKDQM